MENWLRPVFTRSKTPSTPIPSDRSTSFSTDDDNTDNGEGLSNKIIGSTSRVSSYINLHPHTSPTLPASPAALATDTFPNFRDPNNVYHKPSADQMAEMLKVVMMNQSSIDPIPVQYNFCILHVLEAYQDLKMQLLAKEEAIESLKQSNTRDIKDFEELAGSWHEKEKDYAAEVKNLEVLLSRTAGGGLEMVSMARSNSKIRK
jgi:hypothetical protein